MMDIIITTPTLKVPHGGTRVLNEWAVRLSEWHTVTLFVQDGVLECPWYDIPPYVALSNSANSIKQADCVIIGSPHSIDLQRYIRPKAKGFLYMQMLEHMFAPKNTRFQIQCKKFYLSPLPMFYGSQWNIDFLVNKLGRKGKNYLIGNTTNLDHFPIEKTTKGNIVLVEGWEPNNPAKDTDAIGPKVAKRLKEHGYKIVAFSQKPLETMADVPDEYYQRPSLEKMNELYRDAKILLKVTKYDNRSTSPLEAMAKGTPTVRGLLEGDEDLIHRQNCLRTGYNEEEIYNLAMELLTDTELYETLSNNCLDYVQTYTWDYWMNQVNDIICSKD